MYAIVATATHQLMSWPVSHNQKLLPTAGAAFAALVARSFFIESP
ncbi:hypothetical protein [Burkholderia ubonensis]|nr:hypothetical protein [Burkholderia ubonensis]